MTSRIPDTAEAAARMIAVCHVWTAPAMQEESDVSANVGCGHVFGPQAGAASYVYGANYSITSSARAMTTGGMVMPSAFAVLTLMISSYLVGACTGKSAGFAPLRILST